MRYVRVEQAGPVRHVIISRAEKRNALSSAVYAELGDAFADAAQDAAVACVVVRGDGPAFSAGNDVAELAALSDEPGGVCRARPLMLDAVNLLEEMTKPAIAQIHGACIGGGAELALACDLRVMADDATIGLPETRLGLIPDLGGSSRLPAIVGLGRAKEIVMTARPVGAAEALRIGLVNRVGAATELSAVTAGLVAELLACAPDAVGLAKHLLDAAARPALGATLELEAAAQDALVRTDEFSERMRAATRPRTASLAAY